MKRHLSTIILICLCLPVPAAAQVQPFTGKLYNRAWYQSVPETWASYLMQLNVGGVTKIQFNADGSATFAGDITANGVLLGAGGGASAIGDLSDWPAGVSATEVGYLDGLTGAITTLLGGKAASSHSHAISDVTDLTSALSGKAASSHSHAQSDVTDLVSALGGKSDTGHGHAISDVTDLTSTLSGKADASALANYAPIDNPAFTTKVTTPAIKVTGGTPGAGKVLTSDADGDGAWAAAAAPTPAGSDTQVQFNNAGALAGASGVTYSDATGLAVGSAATGSVLTLYSDRTAPVVHKQLWDAAATVASQSKYYLYGDGVTPAAGFGQSIDMLMETSTTDDQPASRIETTWLDATHATRKAQLGLYVSEAHGEEVGLRVQGTSGTPNVIGGYSGNTVTAGKVGAFIGGGGYASNVNSVTGDYCAILGGFKNTAIGGYGAAVVAGVNNTAGHQYAFVGGGYSNTASAHYASVLGGANNTAATRYSSILGGAGNITQNAYYSSVLGGKDNTIDGGYYAVAGGRLAYVTGYGTFAWSDSTDARFDSTTTNEFAVRATGGVRFVTDYTTTVDDNVDSFTDAGDWFNIAGHAFANGDQVRLTTTGALPTGLAIDTDYWIINNDGAKFNLAIAPNSTTVRTFSGTGSGTATVKKFAKTGARIDTAGVLQADGGYKSADGTAGMTDTRSWDDADGNTHAVTIKNGLITAWTVTPP